MKLGMILMGGLLAAGLVACETPNNQTESPAQTKSGATPAETSREPVKNQNSRDKPMPGQAGQAEQMPPTKQELIASATPDMQKVLEKWATMNPKPLSKLSAEKARQQPAVQQAAAALRKEMGQTPEKLPVGDVKNMEIQVNGTSLPVRVYTPEGEGPFPLIVYFRGGGWVIANLDIYDASCRALTKYTGAVVMSVDYRMAPEHKFPTAHEDTYAALQWAFENQEQLGTAGQPVAVAGESAGGNMAFTSCLLAQERGGEMPVHMALIYPVAAYSMDTPSYVKNQNAVPLSKPAMKWFFDKYLTGPSDGNSNLISLVKIPKATLASLPPATVINADIDPLMSEGKDLAMNMKAAGNDVQWKEFQGVTHEFFGLGQTITQAKEAEMFVANRLKKAFAAAK